jgi:hypothetical protein
MNWRHLDLWNLADRVSGQYGMVLAAASVHAEGKLMWDYQQCELTNNKAVNKWVKPVFRKGWELKL